MATILVVDDDDLVRMAVVAVLSCEDYTVLEAADGQQALELLSSNEPVDLVFSDVMMPGINGAEVARRAAEMRPGIKVMLTSGYSRDILKTQQIGPDVPVLRKPYRNQELLASVAKALDGAQPAAN